MPTNNPEHLQALLTHLSQEQVEQTTEPEFEKWEYLKKQFAPEINNISLSQKVGHYLKKHSAIITISSGLFYTMLIMYIYEHYLKNQRRTATITGGQISQEKWLTYFQEYKLVSGELLAYFVVAFLITGLLALTYKSLRSVGENLENRTQHCYQELINFVKTWDKHKTKTPIILHSLFEQLSIDFEKSGKFTTIDVKDTKHFIDTIIATSLYINSSLET
jgi:hypothetical protein